MALRVIQIKLFTKLAVDRLDKFAFLALNGKSKLSKWSIYSTKRDFNCTCKTNVDHKTRKTIFPKRIEHVSKRPSVRRPQSLAGVKQGRIQYPLDEINYDDVDELDHLAHSITVHGSKHSTVEAETVKTKELLKLSSFVRAKTIGHQHFRPAKKTNLLTWACKEQIRFLHEKDPEEWSVQELAEQFPVSELSISKILKSRVRLNSATEIKEHDLFVKRNWENLFDSLLKGQAVIEDSIKDILTNIGNSENLFNVFPLESDRNPKELSVIPRRRKMGVFSSMVRKEIEKKELEIKLIQEKHQEELGDLRQTVMKVKELLEDSNEDVQNFVNIEKEAKKEQLIRKGKQSHKNHQVPFKISTSDSGERIVDGSVYDENGDFLYRIP